MNQPSNSPENSMEVTGADDSKISHDGDPVDAENPCDDDNVGSENIEETQNTQESNTSPPQVEPLTQRIDEKVRVQPNELRERSKQRLRFRANDSLTAASQECTASLMQQKQGFRTVVRVPNTSPLPENGADGQPLLLQLEFQSTQPGAFPIGGRANMRRPYEDSSSSDDDSVTAEVTTLTSNEFNVTATWVHDEDQEEHMREEIKDMKSRIEETKIDRRRRTIIGCSLFLLFAVGVAVTVFVLVSNNADLTSRIREGPSEAPTMAPTQPIPKTRVIETIEELYQAVDDYLEAGYTTTGEGIHNMATWNISQVTTLASVFDFARKRDLPTYTFNDPAVNSWDTSSVTSLSRVFASGLDELGLAGVFNQPLDNWDTSNVQDMYYQFQWLKDFNQDLSNWDTSSLTNMQAAFAYTPSFNGDISTWDVSKVRTMRATFQDSGFNGDISSWDLSIVTSLYQTFQGSSFNQDLSSWNVSNVECFYGTFSNTKAFNQSLCAWDIAPAAEQVCQDGAWSYNMFYGAQCPYQDEPGPVTACQFCGTQGTFSIEETPTVGTRLLATTEELYAAVDAYLEQGYLTQGYGIHNMSAWNVSLIADFSSVFDYQRNRSSPMIGFNDPGINNWDVSRATTFSRMFRGGAYQTFEQAFDQPLDKWKTSNVVDFSSMFELNQFNQDLSSWDTSSATSMQAMFAFTIYFDGDVSKFNTSSVTNMDYMFYRTFAFNRDIGDWDVSSVTSLLGTFSNTGYFNQDIKAWDVSKVGCFGNTFDVAGQFNQDLCGWNVTFRDFCQDGRRPFNYRTFRASLCPEKSMTNTSVCYACV